MYVYEEDRKPIPLDELDWNTFIKLQAGEIDCPEEVEGIPLVKIPFTINTPYLQKDFILDLIVWNLSAETMEITQKTTSYVLQNFDKLFETGWTLLYHYLCDIEPDTAQHTLAEFYREQIDFSSPYYSIQLEINSECLMDGIARYCFIVTTACGFGKWMISDDDMRAYMIDNKCRRFDTNNDDTQMIECEVSVFDAEAEDWNDVLEEPYKKMERENFQYVESFQEFVYPIK